jgi:uncharacterized membrane protein
MAIELPPNNFSGDPTMITKSALITAALGSLLALGSVTATAADDSSNTEKCYGVAKAGKNDCAGAKHACAGQGTKSSDANEWVKLPKGTCDRLVGGSTTAPAKK